MHRLSRYTKFDGEDERLQNEEQTHFHTNTDTRRRMKRFLRKRTWIIIAILFIAIFNIFNAIFNELPKEESSKVSTTHKQETSSTQKPVVTSTQQPVSTSTQKPVLTSTQRLNLSTESPLKVNITFYRLIKDPRYNYEFRFEWNTSDTNTDDPRLMILLNGSKRSCIDYWEFPVGRRILAILRTFRFSFLAICTRRKKFDPDGPVQNNSDVKWIYYSLQKWMHEVYYQQFHQYPRLYIHGISRGSQIAALLCRVLPIQAQIYTIYPGQWQGLTSHSDHHIDLQTRLQLDPMFANWFYFDFCYDKTKGKTKTSDLCPFGSARNNYQPVTPIYFIHLTNDPYFRISDYSFLIKAIKNDSFQLGGTLLNDTEALKFYILPPSNITPTYMQKSFDMWNSKPYASELFYQHYIGNKIYKPKNKTRRTCLCLQIDFRHYDQFPDITKNWPKQKQDEYNDYANDIIKYGTFFCEEICGDLYTHHAISSRDLDKALDWINEMDYLRHSLYIKDYLTRPLRIWMYEKSLIITKEKYFSSHEPNWINISKPYQMYSPEYYLQDYFQRLKASSTFSRHNLKWADNPLLADYFIIPSDLMFYYFYSEPVNMTDLQFESLHYKLNSEYFNVLLKNIQTIFPYWTMAKKPDQMGSNHIFPIFNGRNMGFLYNDTQNMLKNVIHLVFTGIRQDMLPPDAEIPYGYRHLTVVYRHGYDVVIPQFTRLKLNGSTFPNSNTLLTKKNRLLFFAGGLSHFMTFQSARPRLSSIWKDITEKQKYNMTTEIQGRQFDTIKIIEGHMEPHEYVEAIQSSVFSLCPEGFLPWSPRIYEAIQFGAIPAILADNIVLPFERFIDWQSFSVKINVSNIRNITNFAYQINNFEQYITQKLRSALPYLNAFQWPYSDIGENGQDKHVFLPYEDRGGSAKNVFHYISLELRCRRLEQLYGLTSESFSMKSIEAQQLACNSHPTICPCHNAQQPVAFREYV